MGLQVRIRHALGERVLDLPERGVDRPLVIGRSADADVQVPSVHVGLRHLVLFVHEGKWVAQDAPGTTGTSVNGSAMNGARPLRGGDVLALGPEADPPTLEVDAAAITGDPAALPAAAAAGILAGAGLPPLPPAPARPAAVASPSPVTPPRFAPPVPEVVVETLSGNGHGGGGGAATAAAVAEPMTEVPATEWAPEVVNLRPARRRGRNWVGQLFGGLTVVLSVGIVTAAVLYVYVRQQDKERQERAQAAIVAQQEEQRERERREAVARERAAATQSTRPAGRRVAPVAPTPEIAAPPPPKDITEEMDPVSPATRPAAAAVASGRPETAPATRRVARAGDIPDPQFFGDNVNNTGAGGEVSEEEREWKRVESVYYHPNIAKALLTFDAFAERFPGSHKQQLEKYREDMLDKLWWSRIDSLVDRRKKAIAQIKETQAKIKAETEEAFKKTVLEPQFELQKAELARVTDRLRKDMMYNIDAAPPIGREPQLKALRAKRDLINYEQWKKATLKYIRDNHGAYPWANEG